MQKIEQAQIPGIRQNSPSTQEAAAPSMKPIVQPEVRPPPSAEFKANDFKTGSPMLNPMQMHQMMPPPMQAIQPPTQAMQPPTQAMQPPTQAMQPPTMQQMPVGPPPNIGQPPQMGPPPNALQMKLHMQL